MSCREALCPHSECRASGCIEERRASLNRAERNRQECEDAASNLSVSEPGADVTWRHIFLEEAFEALAETDPAKLREELIQALAVGVAWIEDIDSRT